MLENRYNWIIKLLALSVDKLVKLVLDSSHVDINPFYIFRTFSFSIIYFLTSPKITDISNGSIWEQIALTHTYATNIFLCGNLQFLIFKYSESMKKKKNTNTTRAKNTSFTFDGPRTSAHRQIHGTIKRRLFYTNEMFIFSSLYVLCYGWVICSCAGIGLLCSALSVLFALF